MSVESTELAIVSSSDNLLATLKGMQGGQSNVVSTFEESNWETKTAVFDAMTNALPVGDNLGSVVNLRNWVIQPVEMPVDETDPSKGTQLAPRVILIDEDGSAYAAISLPIVNALATMAGVFGAPATWPGAIPVVVTEQKSRKGYKFYSLSIHRTAPAAKK